MSFLFKGGNTTTAAAAAATTTSSGSGGQRATTVTSTVPSATWHISSIHNILPFLDRKDYGRKVLGRNGGDKVPVCVWTENTNFDPRDKEQARLSKSIPIVYWLNDAPHLIAYNPFIHVIEGPGGFTTPAEFERRHSPGEFRVVPRFQAMASREEQAREYVAKTDKKGEWANDSKFEEYWKEFYVTHFLKTIEARSPLLANKLCSEYYQSSEVDLGSVKYMLYLATTNNYFNYHLKYLDSDIREKRDASTTAAAGANSLPNDDDDGDGIDEKISVFSKKRKRAEKTQNSVASSLLTEDSQETSTMIKDAMQRFLSSEDYKIWTDKMSKTERSEAKSAIRQEATHTQKQYKRAIGFFLEAVKEVWKIMAHKNMSKQRKAIFTALFRQGQASTTNEMPSTVAESASGRSSTASTTVTTTTVTTISNGEWIDEDGEEVPDNNSDEEENEANAQHQLTNNDPMMTVDRLTEIALQTDDCLTCTEVARMILDKWASRLGMTRDTEIFKHYLGQHLIPIEDEATKKKKKTTTSNSKKGRDDMDTESPPEKDVEKIEYKQVVPFASMFYYSKFMYDRLLDSCMNTMPCWTLPFLRLMFVNDVARQHATLHFSRFVDYVSAYDKINSSIIKRILTFVRCAMESGERISTESCLDLVKEDANITIELSAFEQIYRSTQDKVQPISSFLTLVIRVSPVATSTVGNEFWSCVTRVASTRTSHYIQRLHPQIELFKRKITHGGTKISPFLYYSPPSSVMRLYNGMTIQCDHSETLYFYLSTNGDDNGVTLLPFADDDDDNTDKGPSVANSKVERAVWACNQQHFEFWLRLCEFIKREKVTLVGEWHEYLVFGKNAVDQSILMSLVASKHLHKYAMKDGMVIYLPMTIMLQLGQLIDRNKSYRSRWINMWLRLAEQSQFFKFTSCKDLEQVFNTGFPEQPYIYVPHAESLLPYELDLIRQVYTSETAIRQRVKQVGVSNRKGGRIFMTFSPVLGGFSYNLEDCDGQMYYLLMKTAHDLFQRDETLDMSNLRKSEPLDVWLPPPPSSKSSANRKSPSKKKLIGGNYDEEDDDDDEEEEMQADRNDSHVTCIGTEQHRAIFNLCESLLLFETRDQLDASRPRAYLNSKDRFFLSPLEMPTSDTDSLATTYLNKLSGVNSFLHYQKLDTATRIDSLDNEVDYDESHLEVTPKLKSSISSSSNTKTAAAAALPLRQKTVPFGLVTDQMSQPHYQVLEYAETHWRKAATLYVIDIPDQVLITIHPMRFANILCRARRFTYCLEGGIDQWRVWVDYWSKKPGWQLINLNPGSRSEHGSDPNEQKSNQQIKNFSIPIFAYTNCGITTDSVCKMHLEAVGRRVEKVKITDSNNRQFPKPMPMTTNNMGVSLLGDESAQDAWGVAQAGLKSNNNKAKPTIPTEPRSMSSSSSDDDDDDADNMPPPKRPKLTLPPNNTSSNQSDTDRSTWAALRSSSSQIPTYGRLDEGSNMSIPIQLATSQTLSRSAGGDGENSQEEDAMAED